MQFLLSHPGVAPFVQQVGRALWEANMLGKFATTLVDRPNANWRKILSQLVEPINIDIDRQFQRRSIQEFPLELVVNNPWGEVANLIARKIDRDGSFSDFIWEKAKLGWFVNWATRLLEKNARNIDAVYGYECCNLKVFTKAKQLNKACVYDVPAPEHDFVHQILQITHREKVKAMRQSALDTAAQWQWSDYRVKLVESIKHGLEKTGHKP